MPIHKLSTGHGLAFSCFGPEDGVPMLYFHGFPGSRAEGEMMLEGARELGIRVIAIDRPGYGMSDLVHNRQLCDWPTTIREFLDAMKIKDCFVLGISGGAPYALACSRYLRDRIKRAGIVCGLGPYSAQEAVRAFPPRIRAGLALAHRLPGFTGHLYSFLTKHIFMRKPELMLLYLNKNGTQADQEALKDSERQELFRASFTEAFRQGGRGPGVDLRIYTSPWGFELNEIEAHVLIWHGCRDRTVPYQFSTYANAQINDSKLTLYEDDGHFSLPLTRMQEMLSQLIA